MLCRKIIAVCTHIHIKYIITLFELIVVFVNIKMLVHIVTTGL